MLIREFIESCRQNNLKKAELLLDKKADVNYRDEDSYTALMYVVDRQDCLVMQRLLIERKALINLTGNYHVSALNYAVLNGGSVETVRLLLENKADFDQTYNGAPLLSAINYKADSFSLYPQSYDYSKINERNYISI